MTVDEFIVEAKHRYVTKMQILSNMFKVGYQNTEDLECRMRLANGYIMILDRLGGDYALTDDEINAVMNHLIILLEMRNITLPDVEDFRNITEIHDVEYVYIEIPIPPVRKSYNYNVGIIPSPAPTGMVYTTNGDTSVTVTITHNLGVINPTIEVVETTGLLITPKVNYDSTNAVSITFAIGSTSTGTITISE